MRPHIRYNKLRVMPIPFKLWKLSAMFLVELLLIIAFGGFSVFALDLGYSCQAHPSAVFDTISQTTKEMKDWRSIRRVSDEYTIKAVVRNWRNLAVPIWVTVRLSPTGEHESNSEMHILWEQSMEPLNYPDMYTFLNIFQLRQQDADLHCVWIGSDVGP